MPVPPGRRPARGRVRLDDDREHADVEARFPAAFSPAPRVLEPPRTPPPTSLDAA